MYRLVSKRELALYAAQIADLRKEVQRLQQAVEHERKRAEGAINLLLIRTVKAAITPDQSNTPTFEQQEELREKMFDIFGDGKDYSEDETLEKLQS